MKETGMRLRYQGIFLFLKSLIKFFVNKLLKCLPLIYKDHLNILFLNKYKRQYERFEVI